MAARRYEVVTFTGQTWENLDGNVFTSRRRAEEHLGLWMHAAPGHSHKIVVRG